MASLSPLTTATLCTSVSDLKSLATRQMRTKPSAEPEATMSVNGAAANEQTHWQSLVDATAAVDITGFFLNADHSDRVLHAYNPNSRRQSLTRSPRR